MQLSNYSPNLREVNEVAIMARTINNSERWGDISIRDSLEIAMILHKEYIDDLIQGMYKIEPQPFGQVRIIGYKLMDAWSQKEHHKYQVQCFKELVARDFIPRSYLPIEKGKYSLCSNLSLRHPRLFESLKEAEKFAETITTRSFTRIEKL